MFDLDPVELSRLQFALTALYHFLFVPLTLGLSFMLAIMESVYVMTNRRIWREMTQFWGKLFGINFAMGVATGITMEFQFGTNWSYYSHYVGDIFGAPLAIEGLMAFFLEATFIGLFFFGWDKLSKRGHLLVTWLVAFGSNFSALWILIANGWMQNPVGATFNFDTMRMELVSFWDIMFNPVAQAKFVHTVSAGYVTGAMFVLAISSWYLLRGRHIKFARRSFTVAACFGLASALSVVVLGDESGYGVTEHQQMKMAAIEAMWETEEAPAGFTILGFPGMETHETHAQIHVPWVLGIIATRSLTGKVHGIKELVEKAEARIRNGIPAYMALQTLRKDRTDRAARDIFDAHWQDLGYALLLKRYVDDPAQATNEQIKMAAKSTIPNVPVLFWAFRIMVGLGFYFIALFAVAFLLITFRQHQKPWFLWIAFLSLPLPWVAAELGWIVAEYGRQPWAIEGILPTFLGGGSYGVDLISKIMIYAILALSLELLVGSTGLVCFGQAAFFGIGAYATVLLSGQMEAASLFWLLPAAVGIAAGYALFVGALSLRTKGVYFIMVTLAFAQMAYFVVHDTPIGGGTDGTYLYFVPELAGLVDLGDPVSMYMFTLGTLILTFVFLAILLRSRFGRALAGIRVNEQRMRGTGFTTYPYKLAAFTISGGLAGLGGVLFAIKDGFVNPEMMSWHLSGSALMMIILGGLGHLRGALIGAFAFMLLQEFFKTDAVWGDFAKHWHLGLGIVIIAAVAFLPKGLVSLPEELIKRLAPSQRNASGKESAALGGGK
ncbi:MAG: cytochrome ubiquinol oxidase subunit I [Magnetospiraceae bacterium]